MAGTLTARLALAAGASGGGGDGKPPSLDDKAKTLLWVCGRGSPSIARVAEYTRDPDLARPEVKELAYLELMREYADSPSWPAGEVETMMRLIAERDPGFTSAFERFAPGKTFAEWRQNITVADGTVRRLMPGPG